MGKVPVTEQYRPYWGRSLDLRNIESAITQANMGLMARMTDLSRETITLDGDVSAFLQKRLNRVAALDWDCIPATGTGLDEGRSKERAAEVRENLQMIPNFRDRIMDLAWGNFDGRAASELEWLRRGRKWSVRNLHWIHPRRLSFGPNRDLRVIDPQRQTGNFTDVGFPLEHVPYKFVTFRPRLFGDYQEREGLAPRTLYWSFFKRLGTREQLELMEIFGKPWRILLPKFGQNNVITPGLQNVDAYEKAYQALQMLGFHNTARMPPGVEVQIVQPQEGAGAVHNDVVKACRDVLSKLFLGGVATTDAISTGLGSTIGDIHLTEEDLIIAGDARRIAEILEDQLTDAIVVANYGASEVVYAPKFVIRTDPPTDRAAEGNRIKAAIDVGLRVAEEEARERLGFRAVRADEAYISRIQREAPPGQIPPAPAPETVWPVGNSPPPGEIPDLPDVVLNMPDERGEPLQGGPAPGTPPARGAPGLPPPTPEPAALPAAPGDLPAAASSAAADDDTPDDVAQLAAQMTELAVEQCIHQKKNRCRICGVERVRTVEMGEDGQHRWPVAWKPIGAKAKPAGAPALDEPAPAPGDTSYSACPECGAEPGTNIDCQTCMHDDAASPGAGDDDEPADVLTTTTRARTARKLERLLALAPPNEGGNHWHTLDRAHHATAVDGTHSHWFQLPDDTLVETVAGGAHQHRWDEAGRDGPPRWIYGGAHLHALELEGEPLRTQVDGYHDHELQVSATTQSGSHSHCLVLPDGATIESLRSAELAEILEGERLGLRVTYRYRQRRRVTGVGLLSASVLCAAQPETVNGSPDDLVTRGSAAFALQSRALGAAIAEAVNGLTKGKAIRKAVDRAAKAWDRERFTAALEPELALGLMLGALDAAWEAANSERVAPETFSDLYREALLLKEQDPGAHGDPAFSKRPQVDAGQAFIEKEVVTRDIFDAMTASAKRRAFTVANAATEEIARAVKRELVRQVAQGADLADFKKHALTRLDAAGWTPLNPSHVETVFRTNVMTAYNSGRVRQMTQPAVLALRPYWQILGVGDGPPRERPTHAAVNGLVLRADDPFFSKAIPPFGYNCRHRIRSLSKSQGEAVGITDGSTIENLPDPGFASGTSHLL